MRILADENLDRPLVFWLREQGHDVLWMVELDPGRPDPEVIGQADAEDRVLVTSDQDFGGLVFRHGQRAAGVVLLRLRVQSSDELLALFRERWPGIEEKVPGHFLVVTNGRIRIRPLPA